MRIAIIVEHCNKRGGHERYVAELAERLGHLHEVHIFACSFADVENKKVVFHQVPAIKRPWLLMIASFIINNTILLKLNGKFDIIHSQGINALVQNVITDHTTVAATKPIKKIYDPPLTNLFKKIQNYLSEALVIGLEKIIYPPQSKRKIIAVAEGVKREINKYYHKPLEEITVIPNGVDLAKFHPSNKEKYRSIIREKFNIKDSDFLLLFVGGDWERKGLEPAIKALALLNNPLVKLMIVGDWYRKAYYEDLSRSLGIQEQVIFAGKTEHVEQFYGAADLYVFPSYYEAFSLSILEAAATGLPILTTQINGNEDLITDGENGYFTENSPKKLSGKLKQIISNKENLTEISAKIRQKTEENHSWDKTASSVLKVYEEVVKKRKN